VNQHKTCPSCNADLEGELIYEYFLNHYRGDEAKALEESESYGASKTHGRWDKRIGIYDLDKDMTVAFECPFCNHQWKR
jgi:hypothetical protein